MTTRMARWLLPAPAVALTALLGAAYAATRAELPARVATHFDLSGYADDSSARDFFFWMLLNLAFLGALTSVLAAWRGRGRAVVSGWAGVGSYVAGMAMTIGLWTILTQRGLTDWRDASSPVGLGLVAVIGIPLAVAVATMWLARAVPMAPVDVPADAPRLGLAPDETVAIHRREHAPVFLAVGLLLGALIGAVAWFSASAAWLVAGVLAVGLGVATHRYTVSVGVPGVVVRWGLLGWPKVAISLDRIASAHAVEIKPMEWGGWGYRGSLKLFGKAAVVTRRGPGLRLDLHDGGLFLVTMSDPEEAAGLLNDLVARTATT
ncbi:MAG: hypothetical protein WAW88_12000 [Nocardioides sp.]